MVGQTWPMLLFSDMVTLFSLCFFRLDHPGDNRHYHPVLIFLRSSFLEPCHTTIDCKKVNKRYVLRETPKINLESQFLNLFFVFLTGVRCFSLIETLTLKNQNLSLFCTIVKQLQLFLTIFETSLHSQLYRRFFLWVHLSSFCQVCLQ